MQLAFVIVFPAVHLGPPPSRACDNCVAWSVFSRAVDSLWSDVVFCLPLPHRPFFNGFSWETNMQGGREQKKESDKLNCVEMDLNVVIFNSSK
jgi:hypothetical protein